jgi:CheY-like chemotaxis protein
MQEANRSLDALIHGASVVDAAQGPRGAPALPDEFGRPCRLLIVEDADNERQLMAYLLARHGFDVSVARDGGEAMEYLTHAPVLPRCILMDLNMPVANGTETLQWIREDPRLTHLNVFAVTGQTRSPELEPIGRGWDGWFVKPIDVELLLQSIPQTPFSPLVA